MNPSSDMQPGFSLPEPAPPADNAMPVPPVPNGTPGGTSGAVPPFNADMPSLASEPAAAPLQPAPAMAVAGAATAPMSAPQAAADDDVIEKEWVEKAKQIVNATKLDPFEQNRQLAAFKADYMQKRYGKTVRISNEPGGAGQ